MKKTGFLKIKHPSFSSSYLLFLICLRTCLLTLVKTTYESTCANFSTQYELRRKMQKVGRNFTSFGKGAFVFNKISKKFSRNSFFLKIHVRISTEFGTKCDKFRVKWMSIHLGKKSNNFTNKRTNLSALAVINKNFIGNPVGRIWGSNLSQNSIETVINVW